MTGRPRYSYVFICFSAVFQISDLSYIHEAYMKVFLAATKAQRPPTTTPAVAATTKTANKWSHDWSKTNHNYKRLLEDLWWARLYKVHIFMLQRSTMSKASCVENINTFLPEQSNPSPLYPGLQVQLTDPTVFWQFALTWQPPLLELHSSISTG